MEIIENDKSPIRKCWKMEIILNKIKKGITVQLKMEMKIQLENANENSV